MLTFVELAHLGGRIITYLEDSILLFSVKKKK